MLGLGVPCVFVCMCACPHDVIRKISEIKGTVFQA